MSDLVSLTDELLTVNRPRFERSAMRLIAFYLPQFHPIPENDEWWGKGFTEWTNVAKARPMYRGHYQPHVPADLGFYDLRVPETREAQAELARRYGIEAFCYYHYWFAGRRIIERPFNEVLASGRPDFPFCLCWANETWTGVWHGSPGRILIEQTFPGRHDHEQHFATLLPAFRDRRYVLVDGKPLFVIFKPTNLPSPRETLTLWRSMAAESGLPGLYIAGIDPTDRPWTPQEHGFDAIILGQNLTTRPWGSLRHPLQRLRHKIAFLRNKPTIRAYRRYVEEEVHRAPLDDHSYHSIIHGWDNTPRSGQRGLVLHGSTPDLFRTLLRSAVDAIQRRPADHRIVFLKSWNEWAEGNHLEPDLRYGHGYLNAIREVIRERSVADNS